MSRGAQTDQTAHGELTQSAAAVKKYIITGDELEPLHLNVRCHVLWCMEETCS